MKGKGDTEARQVPPAERRATPDVPAGLSYRELEAENAALRRRLDEQCIAEQFVRESRQKYRALFESIDEGFCVVEVIFDDAGAAADCRFLEANPALQRVTGLADVVGRHLGELAPVFAACWLDALGRVVRNGVPLHCESWIEGLGRWMDLRASRIGGNRSRLLALVLDDITQRKRRESRLAFLSELVSDCMRLSSADEIVQAVGAKLGAHLGIRSCCFSEIDAAADEMTILHLWQLAGERPLGRRQILSEHVNDAFRRMSRAGDACVVRDTLNDPVVEPGACAANGVGAFVTVPYHAHGEWRGLLLICDAVPRDWRDDEVELFRNISDRLFPCLERLRAEQALRDGEAKYRGLFDAIDQGFVLMDVLFDKDERPVDLYYVEANPAATRMLGENYAGRLLSEIAPHYGPGSYWHALFGDVARSGKGVRLQRSVEHLGRWYDFYVFRFGGEGSRRVGCTFLDVTGRRLAEAALRASEARQAFLLRLADALRPVADPVGIQAIAARLLGEQLGADRCSYGEIREEEGIVIVRPDFFRDGLSSLAGRYPFADYAESLAELRRGTALVIDDALAWPKLSAHSREVYRAIGVRALVSVPLIKEGRLSVALNVASMSPRHWSDDEVALIREVGERTWAAAERARATAELAALNGRLEGLVVERTAALAESEERFRALVSASAQIVWTTDADGHVGEDAPSWRHFTGQSAEEWDAEAWQDVIHPDDRASAVGNWTHAVATCTPLDAEYRLWHAASGSWRWTAVRAVPLYDGDGRVRGWVGMNTDVQARKEAEETLRKMASELTMVEQEERRRISQILHDDLQQQLHMIRMQLVQASRSADPERRAALLGSIGEALGDAITITRRLSVDLSPPVLEGDGLADALGWLAEQMRQMHHLEVAVDAPDPFVLGDPNMRVLLFQISRELLFNVVKHAGTDRARIALRREDGFLVLRASDEGRGFDVGQLRERTERGFGLFSVGDRLRLFDGTLDIDSQPGQGTRISIRLPVGRLGRKRGGARPQGVRS